MVVRVIYPSYTYDLDRIYNYFQPRQVQTHSILEILIPVTPISKRGTEIPTLESYHFWTNPDTTITREDIAELYRYQLGEDFSYTSRSENLSEKWYTHGTSSQDTDFPIPSAWGG